MLETPSAVPESIVGAGTPSVRIAPAKLNVVVNPPPFFTWVRNMTVDAFFTSKIGWEYLGYMGNSAMSQFSVPAEAVEYALKRSPFA